MLKKIWLFIVRLWRKIMSLYNCHKQNPQPWMSYIAPNMVTFSGKCCPTLVTNTTALLPFQIISNGVYVKAEISPYGENSWTEVTLTVSTVYTEGFFIHSYHGSVVSELSCGAYDFRVQAGEMWYFEPFKVEDFTITTNAFTIRDLLALPLKFAETELAGTPIIAPCDSILPFMYATENVSSGTFTVNLVDVDGGSTELTITVQSLVISGQTYYIHAGTCIYPFLACGKYRLHIIDGANTYYSVWMNVECDLEDIPDGYRALRDINGCVMRDADGVILYEACSDIPPDIIDVNFGYLYNWYAATDVREIAAVGWIVPYTTEYVTLRNYLVDPAGGKLKETGLLHWTTPNTNADNTSGFNGRGSGDRDALGSYSGIKDEWLCWTTRVHDATSARYVRLTYNSDAFYDATYSADNNYGLCVRLIKQSTILTHGQTGTYTGNDGKIYRTICIGTQEWLADNLCETLYRDLTPIPEVTDNATWAALITGARCSYNNDETNAL